MKVLLCICLVISTVSSFGGSEEKFLKKYAMMKIYESCFGPEVVKQIRKEMRLACQKCSSVITEPEAPVPSPEPPTPPKPEETYSAPPNFDAEKLHQAILAYRPSAPTPPLYRPYAPSQGMAPFFTLPYAGPGYSANPYLFPGFPQQSPYGVFPMLGQSYGSRVSRDMDMKSQLEALTSKVTGRVRNVTCVMQELGYLDDNLEPNYQKIHQRIASLPVAEELKRDMQDGVTFCEKFSQCVPEVKRDRAPLSKELIRPMFFFKCYKHKKLEACIMKDVREKYAGVADDDFDNDLELRRTGKAVNMPEAEEEINELAGYMFEFLHGSDSSFDSFL